MIREYILLTNIAFAIDESLEFYKTPPVFLLDEVQSLVKATDIVSTYTSDGEKNISVLVLTMVKLFQSLKCQQSIPKFFLCPPWVDDYLEYWVEMTNYFNKIHQFTDSL